MENEGKSIQPKRKRFSIVRVKQMTFKLRKVFSCKFQFVKEKHCECLSENVMWKKTISGGVLNVDKTFKGEI